MRAGDELPAWTLPITPTLVVSTAIATRDYQDVHHDRDLAQGHGSKDIFVNILTSTGLVQRFVTDWAGPQVQVRSIAIRLGAPAYPYDELVFTGTVSSVEGGDVTVDVTGTVRPAGATTDGDDAGPGAPHVTGTVTLGVAP